MRIILYKTIFLLFSRTILLLHIEIDWLYITENVYQLYGFWVMDNYSKRIDR